MKMKIFEKSDRLELEKVINSWLGGLNRNTKVEASITAVQVNGKTFYIASLLYEN